MPIAQCLTTINSKFCTPEDDKSLSTSNPTVGWCCPVTDIISPQCQSSLLCTNVVTETSNYDTALTNLYLSYAPGLVLNYNKLCGTTEMTLTAGWDLVKVTTTSISSTVPCVYVIQAQQLYRATTTIGAFLEIGNEVDVYMFNGNSRDKTSMQIEGNSEAAVGAVVQA